MKNWIRVLGCVMLLTEVLSLWHEFDIGRAAMLVALGGTMFQLYALEKIASLRLETEHRLRATVAHQGTVINTLRRVLRFHGYEVNIDDE